MIFHLIYIVFSTLFRGVKYFDFFPYCKNLKPEYFLPKKYQKSPIKIKSTNIIGPSIIISRSDLVEILNNHMFMNLYNFFTKAIACNKYSY